ncbi:hypothetical protein [Methanosarcina lacustris]|uniref:hypothetical protein n=1 Tax=Methanosarcina lacustris TaxID=170861 RepID=UPI0009FDA390|nr:hypothetical protein [Methanosarcina lacustris]
MRGRHKNPVIVPDENLKYAQIIKNSFGQAIDNNEISTSLPERQNLNLRRNNNRGSRKTIGFSKKTHMKFSE